MSPHMYACVHQMKSSEVHKGTDLAECIGMDLCQLHLVDISSAVALPGVCESVMLEGEFVEPYGKPDKPFHRGAHLLPFPISVFLTTGESTGGLVQSGRGSRGAREYLLCQNY